MRRGAKFLLRYLAAVGGTVLLLPVLDFVLQPSGSQIMRWSIKLPRTRDPRLVGAWSGMRLVMDKAEPRTLVSTFRADGTGSFSHNGSEGVPIEWGTEAGVLYTRRMATDAWSGTSHPYALSGDGKNVSFQKCRLFDLVAPTMSRRSAAQTQSAGKNAGS